jgi:predicted RNase H-like HicB family nuclease
LRKSPNYQVRSVKVDTVKEALVNIREAAEAYLEDATSEEIEALDAHPVTAAIQVRVA